MFPTQLDNPDFLEDTFLATARTDGAPCQNEWTKAVSWYILVILDHWSKRPVALGFDANELCVDVWTTPHRLRFGVSKLGTDI